MSKIDSLALRVLFQVVGIILLFGLLMDITWILWIPAIALPIAGVTGYCPMLSLNKKIFEEE